MAKRGWTDSQLTQAVAEGNSLREVLEALGLKDTGGSRQNIRPHIERLGLDTNHFVGRGHWKNKTGVRHNKYRTDEVVFTRDSTFNTNMKRRFLLLVEYKCIECGISEWNSKKLTLQIDHIDGDRRNNSLENLRLMCPNCHSQTETFSKNKKYLEKNVQDVNLSTV